MAIKIKSNGTYDVRTQDGRQSKGKPLHPKQTESMMKKALYKKK